MGTPMYAGPAGNPPMMMEHPEVGSLKSTLNGARIIALIFWILGIIWVLLALGGAALAAAAGFGFGVVGLIYPVLFTVINFLTWTKLPEIESLVNSRQYRPARDKLLIWMILGFIAGLIPGIVLLIAYLKFDTILEAGGVAPAMMGGYPQPGYYAPQATPAPWANAAPAASPAPVAATSAPVTPAPVVPPAAPGTTACPRCGRPLTWIPQYSRWYCYGCAQYA